MNSVIVKNIIQRPRLLQQTCSSSAVNKCYSTKSDVEKDATNDSVPATFVEEPQDSEMPAGFFNKSGLLPQHLRQLKGEKPYDVAHSWIHNTEKYQRKIFGRYGSASGVDPKICFPTKEDIAEREEYERIAHPFTLREMMDKVKIEQEARKLGIQKREDDIAKKIEKLENWKSELNAKIAKKESDALSAKERKDRLIEEVRRHFGFTVDPRDERFKELLEQKEKEDRKKQKEAKRKVKEEKMLAKLVEKNATATPNKSSEDPKENV